MVRVRAQVWVELLNTTTLKIDIRNKRHSRNGLVEIKTSTNRNSTNQTSRVRVGVEVGV